mmetsp:Transcript_125896/g.326951  ORF Transcript_125896/g.326951 Transcript_125896/m.326951 type:complete len:965 (+) Transcript_125896:67-2961(+)
METLARQAWESDPGGQVIGAQFNSESRSPPVQGMDVVQEEDHLEVGLVSPTSSQCGDRQQNSRRFDCRQAWVACDYRAAVLLTLSVIIAMYFAISPTSCTDVPRCVAAASDEPSWYGRWHSYLAAAYAALAGKEFLSLVLLCSMKPCRATTWAVGVLSPASLFALVALLGTELGFSYGGGAWAASAGAYDGQAVVYTPRYMAWLVTRPILLLVVGRVCLESPLLQVGRIAVLLDMCIFAAWAAKIITNVGFRWALLAAGFVLFSAALRDISAWMRSLLAKRFQSSACRPLGRGRSRCLEALGGLVLLLLAEVVIHVLAVFGAMNTSNEHLAYTVCDMIAQIMIPMLASPPCEQKHFDAFWTACSSNLAHFVLLKMGFVHVLPCVVDDEGHCRLQRISHADALALEGMLGKPIEGAFFEAFLATEEDQKVFSDTLHQVLQMPGKDYNFGLPESMDLFRDSSSPWDLDGQDLAFPSTLSVDLQAGAGSECGRLRVQLRVAAMPATGQFAGEGAENGGGQQILIALSRPHPSNDEAGVPLLTTGSADVTTASGAGRGCGSGVSAQHGGHSSVFPIRSLLASAAVKRESRGDQPLSFDSVFSVERPTSWRSQHSQRSGAVNPDHVLGSLPAPRARGRSWNEPPAASFSGTLETVSDSNVGNSFDIFNDMPIPCGPFEQTIAGIGKAIQTDVASTQDSVIQTSITWSDAGFTCSCCARPPAIPGSRRPQAASSRGRSSQRSRRRSSSRGSSSSSQERRSFVQAGDTSSDDVGSRDFTSASFDGIWLLCNPEGQRPWMHMLTICGDDVTDGDGQPLKIVRGDGGALLAGGRLELNGDVMHRIGKSGYRHTFEKGTRVEDGEEVAGEAAGEVAREASNEAVDVVVEEVAPDENCSSDCCPGDRAIHTAMIETTASNIDEFGNSPNNTSEAPSSDRRSSSSSSGRESVSEQSLPGSPDNDEDSGLLANSSPS